MRFCRTMLMLMALAIAAPVMHASAMQAPSQSEFVPVSDIPPGEQIPAINMVGAAYGAACRRWKRNWPTLNRGANRWNSASQTRRTSSSSPGC